ISSERIAPKRRRPGNRDAPLIITTDEPLSPSGYCRHSSWDNADFNDRSGVNLPPAGENMTEFYKSGNSVAIEASIPGSAVSLESILCTEELRLRALLTASMRCRAKVQQR